MSAFDLEFTDIRTHLNFDAWHWLPYEDWTVDRLLTHQRVNGCRMCKVCDKWVAPNTEESHVAEHIEFDKLRRAANKLFNAEANGTTVRTRRESLELNFPEGEFTITQAAEFNSTDRAVTRTTILSLVESGVLVTAGTVKGGGRGRPAILYRRVS
jgi:hypothetical protein